MMNVKDKHIVVIGAARSGVAAAILLQQEGANIFVSDFGKIGEHQKLRLTVANIEFEENGHTQRAFDADFGGVSPGLPTETPIYFTLSGMSKKKVFFRKFEVSQLGSPRKWK